MNTETHSVSVSGAKGESIGRIAMRKALWISMFFLAGTLGTRHYWSSTVAQAQVGEDCNLKNGNVNGDGNLDLSDAVYILTFLFSGGGTPVPEVVAKTECLTTARDQLDVCSSELASTKAALAASEAELAACRLALAECLAKPSLTATGQTSCFGDQGVTVIDCTSADFPGQDGFYRMGCPVEGRFVDNGDGTVADNCTGLTWLKDTADVSGDGAIDQQDRVNWQAALKYCDELDYAGHTDWRLPNAGELQSIVDYGRFLPAIDPLFGSVASTWYWTSTTFIGGPAAYAWVVRSDVGGVEIVNNGKSDLFYLRAVRGGH